MRQKSNSTPASSETLVRNIRRATRKHHAAEEKIRIVLDGRRCLRAPRIQDCARRRTVCLGQGSGSPVRDGKSPPGGYPGRYANGIAEAARRADNICEANDAVGVRLRSAINEALGTLVAITADKTRKAAA
jgi:hypothetical protein